MTTQREHLIGLLLGAEEDWPTAFEALVRRLGVLQTPDGVQHRIASERVTIEPFNLRDSVRQDLCIDRLAYWYYHPREWRTHTGPCRLSSAHCAWAAFA